MAKLVIGRRDLLDLFLVVLIILSNLPQPKVLYSRVNSRILTPSERCRITHNPIDCIPGVAPEEPEIKKKRT